MDTSPPTGPTGDNSERLIQQLLALNKAALAITGELELDRVLQQIVASARELAGCKYSALGVLGDDGYIERFPTSGISEVDREKIGAPPRGHGLLGVMLRAGRTLRIPDLNRDDRRVGFPPHHPPMTSLLGVPIFVQGKLVGDLYMTDKLGQPEFTEEDEWLLQLLATHAATALTNARLHAENVEALRRATLERARSYALFSVTEAINRSVHLDEVISLILRSTVDLLSTAGAALYLLEEQDSVENGSAGEGAAYPLEGEARSRQFVARYAIGLEAPYRTETVQLPTEGTIAGRALKMGVTQVVADTEDEPDTIFPRLAGKRLRSLVVVPLIISDHVLGVLSAYSERKNAFDKEAVQLQEAFAAVASTAINNARLYEEARKGRAAAEKEQQRLREVDQMKDEFLSTAAHELRTPLTAVRMASSLLHEQIQARLQDDNRLIEAGGTRLDTRLLDLVGLVEEGSARMHSLVNDLLDLTRLEQGRATLQLEEFDIREAIDSAMESVTPLLESKSQSAVRRLPELGCRIRGDRQRLEQVLLNLLSNAHKYSPTGSPIEVRLTRATVGSGRKECLVSVRDSGPGVPEEERERIFDRFYRSSVHRDDRTSSTGLGLPIARKIVELHGGRLWVEPAPGSGSIFTLAIPVS
jgi:signal transduction histidine kinase